MRPVHTAVQGRLRLHVEGLYRNPAMQSVLQRELAGRFGLRSVTASIQTGNVLIYCDRALSLDEVVRVTAEFAREAAAQPRPQRMATAAAPAVSAMAPGTTWHRMAAMAVVRRLGSSRKFGLSSTDAHERLQQYGANVLAQPHPPSALRVFLGQMKSLPVLLLLGSSVVSVVTGGLADASFILAVVVLNASIGTATEMRAEKSIASLTHFGEPHALVIRDGGAREISADEVVPGDLLLLARGHAVAADARLLTVDSLTVDESALTGESLPVAKQVKTMAGAAAPLAEQGNMVFRGSAVTGGSGLAVVVATSGHTQMGRIQSLMLQALRPPTPMEQQLNTLSRQLALLTCGIAGAVFVLGRLRGFGWLQMLKTSVSLAIAAVPEGLPTVATTTMAYGIWRLRQQDVLVRRLGALESLGGVQVLCLDKTGTITMNRMSVVSVIAGRKRWSVQPGGLRPQGKPATAAERSQLQDLAQVVALCNEASLNGDGEPGWNDSSTESALLRMSLSLPLDVHRLRERYPLQQIQRRTESRPAMTTVHDGPGGTRLLAVKGSPEEVLRACRWYRKGSGRVRLTARLRRAIAGENRILAEQSLRVLGVAWQPVKAGEAVDSGDMTWLGLVALADPPRLGMPRLMRTLHRAGVRTVMITGDQHATASAIGGAIGLGTAAGLQTRDFALLESNGDAGLDQAIHAADVFARVNPTDKLRIVRAFQRQGQVVGMTGDGINDGPALRAADVGIAMGRAGTETAREVADVVLLDDDPRAILVALREGRAIHKNIRTAVHYLVATNLSELLLVMSSIGAGIGQPLSPRQLLWINLLTDVFPALALAVEPPEADVLKRPPSGEDLLASRDLLRLGRQGGVISGAALGSYLFGIARYGVGVRADTLAFLSLTTAQLLHTLSARSEHRTAWALQGCGRGWVGGAIGAGLAVEVLALVFPPLRGLLGISPIGGADLAVCLTSAGASLLLNELFKGPNGRTSPALPPASKSQSGPVGIRPHSGYIDGDSGSG